jgi:hypothetical protein
MPVRPTADIESPSFPTSGAASGSGGGSGSGGSGSGTGSGSAGTPQSAAAATRSFSTGLYRVVRGAADRAEYGPPVKLGPRDTATIEPLATNTVNCFYGTTPDGAKFGPFSVLAPAGVPRTVRVRNLNEINVYSTVVGEGVVLDVQRG